MLGTLLEIIGGIGIGIVVLCIMGGIGVVINDVAKKYKNLEDKISDLEREVEDLKNDRDWKYIKEKREVIGLTIF